MLLRSKPAAAWPESLPHLHTHNPQSWREWFSIWRDMSTVRAFEWVTIYESTSMTLRHLLSIFLLAPLLASAAPAPRERVALSGEWNFIPDVGEATLAEVKMPPAKITVPGAWQAQGFGTPGGSIPSSVVGSDITPAAYLRHNLTARCLYARSVAVPEEWRGQRVFLCVRRVYRYADVTVNGKRVGDYEGFSSPFALEEGNGVITRNATDANLFGWRSGNVAWSEGKSGKGLTFTAAGPFEPALSAARAAHKSST